MTNGFQGFVGSGVAETLLALATKTTQENLPQAHKSICQKCNRFQKHNDDWYACSRINHWSYISLWKLDKNDEIILKGADSVPEDCNFILEQVMLSDMIYRMENDWSI